MLVRLTCQCRSRHNRSNIAEGVHVGETIEQAVMATALLRLAPCNASFCPTHRLAMPAS